jgi:hypothetical protein
MTYIEHLILEAEDTSAAAQFHKAAFGLDDLVRIRPAESPTQGSRGFSVSVVVAQPADVRELFQSASTPAPPPSSLSPRRSGAWAVSWRRRTAPSGRW